MNFDHTCVTVDLDKISQNVQAVHEKAGVPVMAIVKANAYGHGAVEVARCLQDRCAFFGVASVLEALELRKADITNPILVFGQIPAEAYESAITQNIRPSIFDYADAKMMSDAAVKLGAEAPFHLMVDTGMSRNGFQVTEEEADICKEICDLPGLVCEGVFSHYATADSADLSRAKVQAERFDRFYEMLKKRGIHPKIRHMDNSGGIMNFSDHYEMVRCGIVTYGLYPSDEVDPGLLHLAPALQWTSRIIHIKTLPAGREIGYGATYTTTKPTTIATIPVGYADGYKRPLSNNFFVLIHGKKAPIRGKVCRDQIMVDVTDIPGIAVGDQVVLIGKDGDEQITVEQIAEAAGSFNYEFVCGIGRRVPRVYTQKGEVIRKVHYLWDGF